MKNLKIQGLCGLILVFFVVIAGIERLHEMHAAVGNPSAYTEAHALDPLFAFPGSDTNKLSETVEAFEISAKIALPSFPGGESVRQHIYPFRFLTALPATEEARRQLLADPTHEHAITYHTLLLSLITAHEEDLRSTLSLLATDTSNGQYQLFSGKTTTAHIQKVLTEALRADMDTREKEESRFRCLAGISTSCESLKKLQLLFGPRDTKESLSVSKNIPNEIKENRNALEIVYPALATSTIISLKNSACFTDSPAYFSVIAGVSRLSKLPTTQAIYLSDLYLEDVRESSQPFYVALKKKGDSFTYQPFREYLCPDAGADFGKTVAMQKLYDTLTRTPFVFKTPTPNVLQKVADAQKNFTEGPFLTDAAYNFFISSATKAVRRIDPEILAETLGGQREVLRFMETVNESETNSDDFEGVIGYFDDLQIGGSIIYNIESSPTTIYLISRGGLSQLYGLNNATIFPSYKPLITQRTAGISQTKGQSVPYVSYIQERETEPALFDIQSLLVRDVPIRKEVLSVPLTKLQQARAVYVRIHATQCSTKTTPALRTEKENAGWTIPCRY